MTPCPQSAIKPLKFREFHVYDILIAGGGIAGVVGGRQRRRIFRGAAVYNFDANLRLRTRGDKKY